MFSELPKLLDRNFAIAFFLPAAAWGLAACGIIAAFGFGVEIASLAIDSPLVGSAFGLVLTWMLSLFLLAVNYPILRLYEGYGSHHPLIWRGRCYRDRFRLEVFPALDAQATIDLARARGENTAVTADHAIQLRRAVEDFPDSPEWVLPTRFGNLFRAIEVYSRVVYGLDAIPAWPRLQAVMPDATRRMLADAKAQLDFCINLSAGAWLAAILYAALALANGALPIAWAPAAAALVGWGSYRLGVVALRSYGECVKAAFDLHRGDLALQLGLELPRSATMEREMWRTVSRMMIYRSAERANDLIRYRPHRCQK